MRPDKQKQMMAYLTRPAMADGGRIPLSKGNMPIKQALEEIVKEKGTNFTSQKELTKLVADKVGYDPNIKILRPSKYPILKNITYESTSKAFTDKELKNILGDDLRKFKAQGLTDRQIRDRASSRKQFQNLSDAEKAAKRERNKINLAKRISQMSSDELEAMREQDALRMQEQRGTKPKYHRVSNAKSLLWNDLIRAAEANDSYLSFKNFTPEPGKYYNKAETEKIVLVDKQGNEFKFNSLKEDINKFSGYKSEDVFRPYAQREFLNKQGLTQELNRFYGIKPGSRQSVFNIQHVQGIAKNPFNVQLTFADQNISEAGAKRTFDADFKVADTLSKKKAAVKKFYANLGADIPTQLGKKEVGARRSLLELLEKTKFPIKSDVIEKVNQLDLEIIASFGNDSCAVEFGPQKKDGGRIGYQLGTPSFKKCFQDGVKNLNEGKLKTADQVQNAAKLLSGGKNVLRAITKYGIIPEAAFVAGESLFRTALGEKPFNSLLKSIDSFTFGATDFGSGIDAEKFGKNADQKLAVDKFRNSQALVDSLQEKLANLKNITDQGGEGYVGDLSSDIKMTQAQLQAAEQELQKNTVSSDLVQFIDRRGQEIADTQMAKSDFAKRSLKDQMEGIPGIRDYTDTESTKIFPKQPSQMDLNLKMLPQMPRDLFTATPSDIEDYAKQLKQQGFDASPRDVEAYRDLLKSMSLSESADAFSPEQVYGTQGVFSQPLAGGGIAKMAGVSSGVAPTSGPNPQGLLSLKNRVRNY